MDLSTPAQVLSTVNEPCSARMHHIIVATQPVLFRVGLVPVSIVLREIGAFRKNQEVWWVPDVTEMLQCVRHQLLILIPVAMEENRMLHLHRPAYNRVGAPGIKQTQVWSTVAIRKKIQQQKMMRS